MRHLTVENAFPLFLAHMGAQAMSPFTIAGARYDIGRFAARFQKRAVRSLQNDEIMNFLESFSKGRGPGTTNRMRANISSFFNYLLDAGHVDKKPFRRLRQEPVNPRLPKALDLKDRAKLYAAAFARADTWLLMHLYLGKGLRLSEAIALDLNDFHGATFRVEGKGKKVRHLDITPDLAAALRRHVEMREKIAGHKKRKTNSDALFLTAWGGRPGRRWAAYRMAEVFEKAGLKMRPHWLRHDFARDLKDSGVDIRAIQEILGHANINTTQRYTQVTRKDIHDALHKVEREKKNLTQTMLFGE